jgi:hypothetical protein
MIACFLAHTASNIAYDRMELYGRTYRRHDCCLTPRWYATTCHRLKKAQKDRKTIKGVPLTSYSTKLGLVYMYAISPYIKGPLIFIAYASHFRSINPLTIIAQG